MSWIAYLLLCLSFLIAYYSKRADVGVVFFIITGMIKILITTGGIELVTKSPFNMLTTWALLYALGSVVSIPGAFLSPRQPTTEEEN